MLVDAHTHLDRYGENLPEALARIRRLRIRTLAVSMDPPSYRRTRNIARATRWIVPCPGVHPWHAPEWADRLGELDDAVSRSAVLGEIGLDYRFITDPALYPAQQRVCDHFLAAAASGDRVVNLHTTGAEADIVRRIEHFRLQRIIVHWYSGPMGPFRALVGMGAMFTIGVEVLRLGRIRNFAKALPDGLLLTETDNPGGWEWLTGSPGMPELVREVVAEVARIRRTSLQDVRRTVAANYRALLSGSRTR
jgi:TatD DNase family protein